jgi:hypothetical protein
VTLWEIAAVLFLLGGLASAVMATRRVAAYRRKERDSADAGSSWRADFGGDGGDSD